MRVHASSLLDPYLRVSHGHQYDGYKEAFSEAAEIVTEVEAVVQRGI
jgi:hypothetical protein